MKTRFYRTQHSQPFASATRTVRRVAGILTLAVLLPFLMTLGGCTDSPTDSGTSTAGHIKGKVVNSQGKGVQGVKVSFNTSSFGGGIITAATATTGADGSYDVKLPDGLYGGRAEYTTTYNGRQYRLYMSPDDSIDGDIIHDAAKGYVKNFTWKISGAYPTNVFVPGEPHHYGGYIDLRDHEDYNYDNKDFSAPVGEELEQGSTVEVTLTPDGPLLDGSQGTVIKRTYQLTEKYWASTQYHLLDIPVGRYTVSATIDEPTRGTSTLRVSTLPGNDSNLKPTPPGATSILEFWPVDFSALTHGTWGTELYLMRP